VGSEVPVTLGAITGVSSRINLTTVSIVFMGSFIGVLVLYVLGKRRSRVEWLDTYTAGEDPAEWDMTPEQYHYAYRFYEPFEKMINPLLERLSLEKVYESLARSFRRLSGSVARGLSAEGAGVAVALLALAVILIVGVVQ
jgi:hypothetical protein